VEFDYHQDGTLQVFRNQSDLKVVAGITQALDEYEVPWRLLDGDEARALEPALARSLAPIAGALYLPRDGSGDSHQLATGLAAYLAQQGVEFRYDTPIAGLVTGAGRIQGVRLDGQAELFTADAYVVALGQQTPFLLRPLGLSLPIYPLKGYSITARIDDPA